MCCVIIATYCWRYCAINKLLKLILHINQVISLYLCNHKDYSAIICVISIFTKIDIS